MLQCFKTLTLAIAVHQLQYFAFMPVFGMNNGTIAIYSYNYGSGRLDRVKATLRLSMLVCAAVATAAGAVYALFPAAMLRLFNASGNMLGLGIPALRICACSLIFGGLSVILSSSFQSLGYSGFTLLVSVCRQVLFSLPLAWLLSRTGILERVWLAIPVSEAVTFCLALALSRFVLKKAEARVEERAG